MTSPTSRVAPGSTCLPPARSPNSPVLSHHDGHHFDEVAARDLPTALSM